MKQPRTKRPRGFVRRWLRRGLFASLGLGALLGGAYVTRAYTLHPLLLRVAPWVAARLGPYEVSVGSLTGDWRTVMELRDVRFAERGPHATIDDLRVERIVLTGGILALIRGDISELREVTAEGVDLTLDVTTRAGMPPPSGRPFVLATLPWLQIERGACELRTDVGVVDIEGLRCVTGKRPADAVVAWNIAARVVTDALRVPLEVDLLNERGADAVRVVARARAAQWLVPEWPELGEPFDADLATQFTLAGDEVRCSGDASIKGRVAFEAKGAVTANGTGAQLLAGDLGALDVALASAPLRVHAEADVSAMEWLTFLDASLRRIEGTARARLDITGSFDAPRFSGALTLAEGRLRAEGLPSLDALDIELAVTPARIEIVRATCELGSAPVRVTGAVDLGAAGPIADLVVAGDNVLLARTSDVRLRGDLALTVSGPLATPSLAGTLALVGGRARIDVDLLGALDGALPRRRGSATAPRGEGLDLPALGPPGGRLDIAVTTRDPLRIQGNVARGALRVDVRVTGDTAAPVLIGQVFVDPLELALPATTVSYESGAVRFTPDRPNVPQLELFGEARVAGYDVEVALAGTYDAPEVSLSSSPPLAADQLLLLVVSGRPPTETGQLAAAGESLAVFVAKDLVRSWFDDGGFDERRSFLSRIEVVTGRDVSKSGVLTLEATYLVREKLAGRDGGVFTVLERDAYEDYNLGLRFVVRLR